MRLLEFQHRESHFPSQEKGGVSFGYLCGYISILVQIKPEDLSPNAWCLRLATKETVVKGKFWTSKQRSLGVSSRAFRTSMLWMWNSPPGSYVFGNMSCTCRSCFGKVLEPLPGASGSLSERGFWVITLLWTQPNCSASWSMGTL